MKVENLLPKGFQLVMFGNVREQGGKKINTLVLNIVTDASIKKGNEEAHKLLMENPKLTGPDLDKVKIQNLHPLISEEITLDTPVSVAHEESLFESYKIGFISRFIAEQLQLITKAQFKADGFQPIHNTSENNKGEEGSTEKGKIKSISKKG